MCKLLQWSHKYNLLKTCPLAQATWPERIREHVKLFLLIPILQRIAKAEGVNIENVRNVIRSKINTLEKPNKGEKNYLIANLLFLLDVTGDEFTDLQLTGQTIRGVDFRFSWLHHTNMKSADLTGSAFAQSFGTLHAIAVSPDGKAKYIAAGTTLGKVIVWRNDTGELFAERQNHSEVVRALSFSGDGKILYSGGEDYRLVAWNLETNTIEAIDSAHSNWIWDIHLLDDRQRIITAGCDGKLKVWDTNPLREKQTITVASDWIWDVAYSGRNLLCGTEDGSVWLCKVDRDESGLCVLSDGELFVKLEFPVKSIESSKQSPDIFFLGCSNGVIYQLNLLNKQFVPFGPRHRGTVRSIAQLSTPDRVASAGDDHMIRIWNATTGDPIGLLEGHRSRVWSIKAHDLIPIIVSAGDDRSARVWRTDGPTHPERSYYGLEHSVRSLSFDKYEDLIAACCDDVIRRWNVENERVEQAIIQRHMRLTRAQVIGETCIAVSDDGSTLIRSGRGPIRSWKAHEGPIECLCVHNEKALIGTGGEDRIARIWNLQGDKLAELPFHRNRIWDLCFSPNGQYLATGGGDHLIGIWSLPDGKIFNILKGHSNLVLATVWLNNNVLISGGSDGTLRFWDIARTNSDAIKTITLGFVIRTIIYSEDRDVVIVGGRVHEPEIGSKLVFLDKQGNVLKEILGTLPAAIRSLAYNNHSHKLYVAGDSSQIVELSMDANINISENKRLRIDGPYQDAIFDEAIGLSDGQRITLQILGAHV